MLERRLPPRREEVEKGVRGAEEVAEEQEKKRRRRREDKQGGGEGLE